jgi:hypothetical protein
MLLRTRSAALRFIPCCKIFCPKICDFPIQMNHSAVMELPPRNSISSAASGKALGPCRLRNQEKDNDDHFKIRPDRRDRGCGHRVAGIGPVVRSGSRQRQCGAVQLRPDRRADRHSRGSPANSGKVAARQNGLHAFAMVPRSAADGNSNDPALTGGGGTGYNEMLQRF